MCTPPPDRVRSMPYSRASMAAPLLRLRPAPRPMSRAARGSYTTMADAGTQAVRTRASAEQRPAMPAPTMATRCRESAAQGDEVGGGGGGMGCRVLSDVVVVGVGGGGGGEDGEEGEVDFGFGVDEDDTKVERGMKFMGAGGGEGVGDEDGDEDGG